MFKFMTKKRRIVGVLILAGLFGVSLSSGMSQEKIYASTKSGSVNMTKTIKTKTKKGRDIKTSEVYALSGSTFSLLDNILEQEDKDKNVLISPTSIYYAFGMAENGAKKSSRSQLEKVINGGVKTSDFNKILASTRNRMNADKEVKWNVANSVWYINRKDVKVRKSFLKKAKAYYGAEVYKASFNNKTLKDVNSWVKKNTNKMIPKVLENISKDDVMYIINAIAFEGEWGEQFKDYQVVKNQDFTNSDGFISKVTMLTEKEGSYFELNGAYGFKKKYKGYNYSFVGIMIPDNVTPAQYVEQLAKDGSAFPKQLKNTKSGNVVIKFPEFSYDYDIEMSEILKSMGATDVFDKDKANLNNLFTKTDDYNYYFSKVIHKTHIEVDKNGTKAAAVTAITLQKNTSVLRPEKQINITLDHPFVYAIVDDTTNLPVFVGVVNILGK